MESVELYRQLLGLTAPWTVERVELDLTKGRVEVYVAHVAGQRFACPECAQELAVYDHLPQRSWRHLDSMQFLTYLHARPPRVSCPQHGVKQVRLPWAEAGGRFTNLFQALAITVLRATNVKHAGQILRVSWDEAWHIMEQAVRRGRAVKGNALPALLGVDFMMIRRMCAHRKRQPMAIDNGQDLHSLAAAGFAYGIATALGRGKARINERLALVNVALLTQRIGQLREHLAQHLSLALVLEAPMHRLTRCVAARTGSPQGARCSQYPGY